MEPETNTANTRYMLWGAIALGLIIVIAVIMYLVTPDAPALAPTGAPSLPVSGVTGTQNGQTTGGMAYMVPISSGASIAVKDFLSDPATVNDPVNPGYYYLGYHQSTGPEDATAMADPPYVIGYIATTHYFNIGLYQEPIGHVRREAEQYLLNALGISQEAACALKYMVSVPEDVRAIYASQNLGFSFCSGAVKLP